MLFTLTSLTRFPSAKHCCLFVLFSSSVESATLKWRNGLLGDAGEAVRSARPGTGEFEPQISQPGTIQQSTLNTMTPPLVTECAYTCNNMCSPPRLHACSSHTSPQEGEHGPHVPSWKSGLTGAL